MSETPAPQEERTLEEIEILLESMRQIDAAAGFELDAQVIEPEPPAATETGIGQWLQEFDRTYLTWADRGVGFWAVIVVILTVSFLAGSRLEQQTYLRGVHKGVSSCPLPSAAPSPVSPPAAPL